MRQHGDLEEQREVVKRLLYEADEPLSTREIHARLDSDEMRTTKAVLRRMIDRGEVKGHPRFKFGLPGHVRRSMDD